MNSSTEKQLHAYIDGALTPEREADVESMLAKDGDMRKALDELKQLKKTIHQAEIPARDLDVAWSKFNKQINQSEAPKNNRIRVFQLGFGALAAVFILGLFIWLNFEPLATSSPQIAEKLDNSVEMVNTDLENSTSLVYIDAESGWSIVWVEN